MPLWDKSAIQGGMTLWDRNPLKEQQDAFRGQDRPFAAKTLRSSSTSASKPSFKHSTHFSV